MMNERRIVFLTGATGLVGRELAYGFSKLGCSLVLPVRSFENDLKSECLSLGAASVYMLPTDLLSQNASVEICSELERLSLFPDVLINNARNRDFLVSDASGQISRENWINEYLLGVVLPYQLAMGMSYMQNSQLKKIINVASIYGITAPNMRLYESHSDSPVNYGVSKAALIHLTKELAVRLAPKNIDVNAISLGGIEGRAASEFSAAYGRLCPNGRMLLAKEVFEPFNFLASEHLTGMTGHNLVIDGGWTIW
jgi:NAD(P)-dependent dehydrogenase (short-subunit alcohol dehydrogenase family)